MYNCILELKVNDKILLLPYILFTISDKFPPNSHYSLKSKNNNKKTLS